MSAEEKEKKAAKEANKPKGFKGFLNQMNDFNKNPVCANIFAAGFIRSMASVVVTAFLPVFFQKSFPAFKSEYAILNAAALTVLGISSSIIGGIISDKFEKRSYMTKSSVIMFGNILSIPLTAIACFCGNFWLAMSLFAAKIFVSGSYLAPAITMMQNSTDASNSGFVVSAYTFYAHFAQTLSPIIFGYLA